MGKKIIVTGSAGFIGYHLTSLLLSQGHEVTGIDDLRNNGEIAKERLSLLKRHKNYHHIPEKRGNYILLSSHRIFGEAESLIHLAAYPGVRGSYTPEEYMQNNVMETINLFDLCKDFDIKNILFASSSSVYGDSMFQSKESSPLAPKSFYALTKQIGESIAQHYCKTYGLNITAFRFFTVYGHWGRPDMAPYIFTEAILNNQPVKLYGYGQARRDYTYIDDLISGIDLIIKNQKPGFDVFNIGSEFPVSNRIVADMIADILDTDYAFDLLPLCPGEVETTYADILKIKELGYSPKTSIRGGLKKYVNWHKEYYGREKK